MAKSTRNAGQHWEPADVVDLERLAQQNTPTLSHRAKLG
jgi:hypothetical protein